MNQGIIEQARRSQSGKSLGVKLGGQWYQTKNFALEHAVGRKLNYEITTSEFNGQTFYWLDKESLADDPGGPDQHAQPTPTRNVAAAPQPATSSSSFEPGQALPMTSNIVAHAIQAGLIKQPADVAIWAQAAFVAAKGLITSGQAEVNKTKPAPQSDNEFDDDIPF